MDEIIIRKATLRDLEILLCFEQEIINSERSFTDTIKNGHIHYYDIEQMILDSSVELVVAELDHVIIGSGYARIENSKHYSRHKTHAHLGFMYIDPNHRGKGVNRKIIEALRQWALSQNLTEMTLDVYNDNLTAIKAYEKAGFTKNLLEMRIGLTED